MHATGVAALCLAACCAAGCVTYEPMPITPEGVRAELSPPDMANVRLRAAAIEHPLLRPVPFDDRDGLSPDEAAILAVLANPGLRAVRDQRVLADAQLLQAGVLPNPELSYSLDVPVGGQTSGTVAGFGLGLSWDVLSLVRRPARIRAAQARREGVDLDVAWAEWQVAQAARSALYRHVALEAQVALAQQAAQRAEAVVGPLREAVAAGSRTATDLAAAEAASRQATQALIEARKQAAANRLQLNRMLGEPPDAVIQVQEGIDLPSRIDLPPVEDVFGGLEERRLDLIALRFGYASQEAKVRAAVLAQFPAVHIGPTLGRDIENVDTAGFALSADLPFLDRSQGRIAVETATRQRLYDEYVNRVFEARSDIAMLASRIRYLNEQIAAAEQAEPELRSLAEDCGTALSEGRADALAYYAAWSALTANSSKLVALKGQLAEAAVALELAAGTYEIPAGQPQAVAAPAEGKEASR